MKNLFLLVSLLFVLGCQSTGADTFPAASGDSETSATGEVASQTTEVNSAPSLNAQTLKLLWDIEKPALSAGWTKHLVAEIKKTKLVKENPKSDIVCHLDSDEERVEFWAQLISAIAKRESGFKTETNYTEDFKDNAGKNVISRGLLQLSYESAKQSAYKCSLNVPADLNTPLKNLSCGVGIVNHWTKDPATMGLGETDKHYGTGRYWSVCRKYKNGTIKDSYKFIKSYVESLPICKKAV